MKNASIAAKKLSTLLKKLDSGAATAASETRDPIGALVMSMLLWESTTEKANAAFERLMENVVDYNDLRVSMPHETLELVGQRYPRALDRCQRLRAVLRNIYLREHAVNLERLSGLGKREVRKYIESLEGIVPYAAARVLLLCYDTHVIPVDDQLRIQLIEEEIADASVEIPEFSNWLSLQIKAGEGIGAHLALQAWIDDVAGKPAPAEKKPSPKRLPPRKKHEARSGAKAAAG